MLKFYWDGIATRAEKPNLPKLTAACLDQIAVATSPTNSEWTIIEGKVAKGLTVAMVAFDPGIRYLSLEHTSSTRPGDRLFMHLSFFAKFNHLEYAAPVYLSLCWLEEEQTWALSRMITDTWSRVQTN